MIREKVGILDELIIRGANILSGTTNEFTLHIKYYIHWKKLLSGKVILEDHEALKILIWDFRGKGILINSLS